MKRPSSDRPELVAMPNHPRHLNEDERALWDHVARQVKPLRKKPRTAKVHAATVAPERPVAAKPGVPPKPVVSVQPPKPGTSAAPPLAPLG
ncbi:MAG: DNA mismatch repair protein MutS, partial [Bradyrhizobium sp.]